MKNLDALPEGGSPQQHGVFAAAPQVFLNPEDLYYKGKTYFEGWLSALGGLDAFGALGTNFRAEAEEKFSNTKDSSTREMAAFFRKISGFIWAQNLFASFFTLRHSIPIQDTFNNRMWTHNADGTFNHVTSDDFSRLFQPKDKANWPNLVLTSNHARAWKSNDLHELMHGIEKIAGDAWGKPLDLYRFTKDDRGRGKPNVKNKTIVALACHTERDIFLNGAELIDRRCDLEEDVKGNADPKQRTLNHMSPAAMRLAKLMMKLMVEPDPNGAKLVDLDRATDRKHIRAPFIANDHEKTLVLRADAASIAQHIKLVGYSKGANAVTDALRFLHLEYAALGARLQMRDKNGTMHAVTDKEMAMLMGNIGLLSIAPGEVPLTKGEKQAGIKRVTILNKHDLTAGHLVNPETAQYDRWDDRLVKIEGTYAEAGHSITHALGHADKVGFIMDPANAELKNYKTAQDEVRAFFASNHQKQAITTVCFSPEGNENALYVQFAAGINRANEKLVEKHLLEALHEKGFANAAIASDFTHRRRARIVLNHDAGHRPIASYGSQGNIVAVDSTAVNRCKDAFAGFAALQNGHPFVTQDVFNYLDELASTKVANVIHKDVIFTPQQQQQGGRLSTHYPGHHH